MKKAHIHVQNDDILNAVARLQEESWHERAESGPEFHRLQNGYKNETLKAKNCHDALL